jgi:hypothetical protein
MMFADSHLPCFLVDFKRAYITSAIFLSVVWTFYPIAWGLADGANIITPTAEMIFYGVLDFVAKPVFTILHVSFRLIAYRVVSRTDDPTPSGLHGFQVGLHQASTAEWKVFGRCQLDPGRPRPQR